jgi:Protein of unknown function (DUF998)
VTEVSESKGRLVRIAAWTALAIQPLFIAAWLVAGALEPGYSHLFNYISELGARTAESPWIVNSALVLLGLSAFAVAGGVAVTLPRRPAAFVASGLLAAFGLSIILAGFLQVDCTGVTRECLAAREAGEVSSEHVAHGWLASAASLTLIASAFAVARALNDRPAGAAALAAGAVGVMAVGLSMAWFAIGDGERTAVDGLLVARPEFLLAQIWLSTLAAGVLYATRTQPPPPPLTRLRPRNIFAASWVGSGEAFLLPAFVWRRFGRRFSLARTASWLSDEAWVFTDDVEFEGGRVERREFLCRFERPDLIRVTADDLPDGAEVLLEDEGYRLRPYRALARIGPLLVPVWCYDSYLAGGEGVVTRAIEVRLLRVPVARIETTARLSKETDAGAWRRRSGRRADAI